MSSIRDYAKEYVEHPWIKPKTVEKRTYQETIANNAMQKNTLVVVPTGLGKTNIALLVAADRLLKYPNEKILLMAPTKPLVEQHRKTFYRFMKLCEMGTVTGATEPLTRSMMYHKLDIVFSTPQTIQNDIKKGSIDLRDFSLLIVDEAHRCVGSYSYVEVANEYFRRAKHPLILALTASPGYSKQKIEEIQKKLFIENVEIKDREDDDVNKYVQKLNQVFIEVDLPDEIRSIVNDLSRYKNNLINQLVSWKIINMPKINKVELLRLQKRLANNKSGYSYAAMSCIAEILKLDHALILAETQSIHSLVEYMESLKKEQTKASKRLASSEVFQQSLKIAKGLDQIGIDHPKMDKLKEIIQKEIENRRKVIIFAQYRTTIGKIVRTLMKIQDARPIAFFGQAKKGGKGLSQKEQIQILNEFKLDFYNILVCTSIGEEGLDIAETDTVIFYEPIPSEIRKIQRCVPSNTKILMSDGTYKKISEIKKDDRVVSYNKNKSILENKEVTEIFENGIKDLIEIITEKGNSISVTLNHPILTQKGWTESKYLKTNDRIAIAHTFNTNSNYRFFFDLLPDNTYLWVPELLRRIMRQRSIGLRKLEKMLRKEGIIKKSKDLWGYTKQYYTPITLFKKVLKVLNIKLEDVVKDIEYVKSRKGRKIKIPLYITPEFMWFVGIIASDGNLRLNSKLRENRTRPYFTHKFRICNTNPLILDKFYSIIKDFELNVTKDKNRRTIESNNTIIGTILNNFGLPNGRKSKTLKLSTSFFKLDNKSLEGFLSGYFDGDGNYNKGPNQIRIGTASKEFAFQLQSILLRLGFLSKISKFDKNEARTIKGTTINFTGDFYSVEIYRKIDVHRFLNFRNIIKAPKKEIKFAFTKNNDKNIFWTRIKEIKSSGKMDTFNISVQDNDSYIAENIIVHNSGRTARTRAGKVMIMMTRATRDEAFYWAGYHKERKMKNILNKMKNDLGGNNIS